MAYFDPRKATVLIVDASPVGVGALLTQDGKVNAYASRALSDVEKRYSQTEREGLAIVWAIEHFHLYLYGHKFTLVTDHQPLEYIFNNPKSKPPARIQRWRLRLQTYDFDVKYKSGKSNAADYMSRHPNINEANRTDHYDVAEEFVNIQYVIKAVKSGSWENSYDNKTLDTFSRLKNELTIVNTDKGEILMHDNRIVIPHKLTDRVITLAHEGHQGIVRTKQLLREKVYFPGIDKRVEDTCKACIPCLAATPKKTFEPLAMSDLPDAPRTYISMDFCGPFPSGHFLMVIMDEYSRYPVVETLTTISAKAVIPLLDKVFSTFGIPNIVKTDNGSPWQGKEFRDFATYMGFTHRKITPLWPQNNAECERFMRSIGKSIRAAHTQHKNWKQEMFTFLRNYRATKHATTDVSPAKLLFGRNIKTKLPTITPNYQDNEIRETDKRKKDKMKNYADTRRNAEPSDLKIGDTVLVRQDKQNKLSTPYNSNPYKIVERNGTMLTAKRDDGHMITRNSSFYKQVKIPPTIVNSEKEQEQKEPSTQLRTSGRMNKAPAYLKDYVK
ncbi:unnamed protein product [Mytilus coruscus]|uniref:Integrase catalytic domain-containing protein n=1 Tax=Mytilus coruscus TaxID=42192 RepID=A0A6J8EMB2_MYTCO|nr:unnamed protein product [Mytilus coruscus]